ncbi:MAG: RHS repeat-associated core domain-containing protein [Acutalibacteraceae bacterium]|nr:RHS repeat-associated core domain-containing protein [Acutalibacteraceae bacterium]
MVETIDGTEYKTNYSETSDSTIEETNVYESVKTTSYGNTTVTVYSDLFGRTLKEETKSGNTIVLLKVYEYNSNGDYTTEQIKSVTTTVGTSEPETTRYTYDNNGNITGIYSKVGDNTETTIATYEYDELNQLVKENDKSYTYDFGGNILSAGNNTYSYSTGEWKDKLTSFNGDEITYDESGNPLNYLGATLTWKNGRSLATYTKDDLSISYKYNTDGLRTQKTVVDEDTKTTYNYIWNGSNLTHQSWDSKYIHFYYDNSNTILGFTYYNGSSLENYTYIKNMQGDVVGIVDAEGETVATYTYDAWGNILTATGDLANINPIRYRGYYYDDEINMYYLQSRYYDQNVGRFVNSDDVEVLNFAVYHFLGANLYSFCGNNPIVGNDFNGYWNGWWNSVWFVGTALDVIIAAISGGMAIAGINAIKKFLRQNSRKIVKNITKKLLKMIGSTVVKALTSIMDIALSLFATSVGELIAKAIDWCDPWWGKKRNNGYVFG